MPKEKLGLAEEAKVVSCYEAGRDGFWPHRFLEKQGIENNVIDAASMKVSRHGRRAKSDGIDVRQLLNDLVRFDRGDDDVWRVVRVPSEEAEDDRRPHRELERLKKERTQHRNAIKSLMALHGVQVKVDPMKLLSNLDRVKIWNGQPLPETYLYVLRATSLPWASTAPSPSAQRLCCAGRHLGPFSQMASV